MSLAISFTASTFRIDGVPYAQIPVFVDPANMRIQYLPTEWIIHQAVVRGTTRSPKTWKTYAYGLLDWLRYCCSQSWDWAKPEEQFLAHFRNDLERRSPKLARGTIAKKMLIVCWFYEWAFRRGHVETLPISVESVRTFSRSRGLLRHLDAPGQLSSRRVLVPKRSTRERLPRFFNKEEQGIFMSALSTRNRIMAGWALFTGARQHEICALTTDQIPPAELYRTRRLYPIRLRVTKGSVDGEIHVPSWLLDETYRYISLFERRAIVRWGRERGRDVPAEIFLSRRCEALKPDSVYNLFKKTLTDHNIPGTFHDLRHTYAITMLDLLMRSRTTSDAAPQNPLLILKTLLRHADTSTTERYLRAREFYLSDIYNDTWDVPEVQCSA